MCKSERMTDIAILNQLEDKLGFQFKKRLDNYLRYSYYDNTNEEPLLEYSVDINNNIVALRIEYLPLNNNFQKICEFENLRILILRDNELVDINTLNKIRKSEVLSLADNDIKDITCLTHLNNLRTLILDLNPIHDISVLASLEKLRDLSLFRTQINNIRSLKNLNNIRSLYLNGNNIKILPEWITDFGINITFDSIEEIRKRPKRREGGIVISGNDIKTPPVEICRLGRNAIMDWFTANKKKLNEIKVLLVGDAKAGKTSLVQRLKYNTYNETQKQTDGIIIEPLSFRELNTFSNQSKLHGTKAYFWDFGGQEIMSSTHQFFMTNRSVYILLLEARKDAETDKQVRQWMERIKAFGGNSHVIIVGNKIELNRSFGIDTTSLQKDYPQVKQYINVSCKTGENIEDLKSILEDCIPQAELFDTEIDERWIAIKNELQEFTEEKYKLSHGQFIAICNKHELLESNQQNQCIQFLNDLGIVLHFDEIYLSEYYVLDPLWVTAGVYRILTSEIAATNKGIINTDNLTHIVNEEIKQKHQTKHIATIATVYSPNECRFLADIMAQFKLSYYSDHRQKILIPDLLDKETPKEESERFANADEKLSLIYEYKYLPSAVIHRLTVALKNDIEKAWRTGVTLKCRANIDAEAIIFTSGNMIRIIVLGNHKQKREYLSIIRYTLDEINVGFKIDVTIRIPLPEYEEYSVKYDHLLKMERRGDVTYENLDIEVEFNISRLLDGIATKEQVIADVETLRETQRAKIKKVKIFLASSSELKTDREQFEIFINRENKEWVDKGVFFELVIWEDFLDSMSKTRLQDEYNNAIKECDIFVMLFFKKVGLYTQEEFETAFGQFIEKSRPLIYTYFKKSEINIGSINPEEMKSVWAFQEKLKELGHFQTVYENVHDLKYQFSKQLDKISNLG